MLITTLDRIFRLAFALGAIALTAIVACYACEVVMRYFFNAPTRWASDTVSFLLLASVFLVAPWLTRENGHVAVTLLPDLLPEKWARLAIRLGFAAGAIVCIGGGIIAIAEAASLFRRGTMTYSAIPFPKWILTSAIAFGLVGCGLAFIGLTVSPPSPQQEPRT